MPRMALIIILALVFTTILSLTQAFYWAWTARRNAKKNRLLKRLGQISREPVETQQIFRGPTEDEPEENKGAVQAFLSQVLREANSSTSVTGLLTQILVAFLVVTTFGVGVMGATGLMLGLFAAWLPYGLLKRQGTKRKALLAQQLPESLDLMSRAMQAGMGLTDTFRLVAEEMPVPIATEFGGVFEEIRFGRDFRDSLGNLILQNPDAFDLRIMVSSILLQRETGGNLIELFQTLSETMRARALFGARLRAMTSEARMSAFILGSLPLFLGIFIAVVNPEYLSKLWTDPLGWVLLGYSGLSYLLGIFLMRDLSIVEV